MEVSFMADVNVQRELQTVNDRLSHHDLLLERLGDVSLKQVELTEKFISNSDRFKEYRERTDEHIKVMAAQIDNNKSAILKWGAAATALITGGGFVLTYLKIIQIAA